MTVLANSEIDWFAAFRHKDDQVTAESKATRSAETTIHKNDQNYRVVEEVESVAQEINIAATRATQNDLPENVAPVAKGGMDQATATKLLKNDKNKGFHEDVACVASVAHERYDVATFIREIEKQAEIYEYVGNLSHFESMAQAYEEQRNDWYERNSNDPNN